MKINCIIVDDEFLAKTLLEEYINRLPHIKLVRKCSGAIEAIEVLQTEPVDLMFLDVQMPDLTGIDLLKSLQTKPVVIFTTAYPEYAIDGYSLDVIDYLLKPISFDRFVKAVNKATDQIKLIKNKRDYNEEKEYITLKAEHKIHKVNYDNILYIEGLKEYVIFYLKEGKRIITLEALKTLEELLPNNFLRVHRSFIINKNDVRSLHRNIIEIGDKEISIGKTFKDKVEGQLFK